MVRSFLRSKSDFHTLRVWRLLSKLLTEFCLDIFFSSCGPFPLPYIAFTLRVMEKKKIPMKCKAKTDVLTPSFLSLSRAPFRKSMATSSFSSSHWMTKGSNHLRDEEHCSAEQSHHRCKAVLTAVAHYLSETSADIRTETQFSHSGFSDTEVRLLDAWL